MIRNPKLKVHKEENRVNEQKVVIFCSFFVFLEMNKVWMAFRLETGKEDRMNAIMQKRKRIGTILYPEGGIIDRAKSRLKTGRKC